jgi:hypothetical protein
MRYSLPVMFPNARPLLERTGAQPLRLSAQGLTRYVIHGTGGFDRRQTIICMVKGLGDGAPTLLRRCWGLAQPQPPRSQAFAKVPRYQLISPDSSIGTLFSRYSTALLDLF